MPRNQQVFTIPKSGEVTIWEAEMALKRGFSVVPHEWASGGAYVEPSNSNSKPTLEFRFKTDRPTTIKVFPLWWRHGEQKSTTRFPSHLPYLRIQQIFEMAYPDPKKVTRLPFPIPARFGPDALDAYGERLFFTAPETGRVGVVDLTIERLAQALEVGGYLTDLVVDKDNALIYVADGMGNRIIAIKAQTGEKISEVAVPAFPFSIALHKRHLFVACLQAKTVAVVEVPTLRLVHQIGLPLAPQHVEVRERQLLVWVAPSAYDAKTLAETVPERLAFFPLHPFPEGGCEPPLVWQSLRGLRKGGLARLFSRIGNYNEFHVQPQVAVVRAGSTPAQLLIRWTSNPPHEEVLDVSEATQTDEPLPALSVDFPADASPDRYCVADGKFFFTLPAVGKVVCHPLSPQAEPIIIPVGGYLTDMAAFTDGFCIGYRGVGAGGGQPLPKGEAFAIPMGKYVDQCLSFFPSPDLGRVYSPDHLRYPPKVYIADGAGNRVIVLDPQTLRITKSIPVSAVPIALRLYGLELFVTCRKGREVIVVDVRTDEIVRRKPLPAEPIYADVAKFQPPYTATEFRPPPEVDDAPVWFVAHFHPLAFNLDNWQPTNPPEMAQIDAILYRRRQHFERTDASGHNREVFADNMHTLRFGGERWLDVSEVTDPKRQKEPALLRHGDLPGSITLSLDGGLEHDWMRGIWLTPKERRFLVNPPQTLWQQGIAPYREFAEVFRSWNAPAFNVAAGEHVLRVTAHSPYACLDGLLVWKTLEGTVEAALTDELSGKNETAPSLPASMFATSEPVRFMLRLHAKQSQQLQGEWQVLHPVDGQVQSGTFALKVLAGEAREVSIAPSLKRMGLFTLRVRLQSKDGMLMLERLFVKLPPLTHPRLLCRAEELPVIRTRIAQHRELFRRWRLWLEANIRAPSFFAQQLDRHRAKLGRGIGEVAGDCVPFC